MNVVFRTDASLLIGTGHVMRCLTLAKGLKKKGGNCVFVSRAHKGNLIALIQQHGFEVRVLATDQALHASTPQSAYATWLGSSWEQDAEQTRNIAELVQTDWLVVDHYALDRNWETRLIGASNHLMVIDDLANRPHTCDLLLDQTFARSPSEYQSLVTSTTTVLCGTDYALLRPQFSEFRPASLRRRHQPVMQHILISMGGIDNDNHTCQVLLALEHSQLPADIRVTVIMGSEAPWISEVQALAECSSFKTEVLINVTHMAQLLDQCDLAIGAAGSSAWERCCLGVPSVLIVLAENQSKIAAELDRTGAAIVIRDASLIGTKLPGVMQQLTSPDLQAMSLAASRLVDGAGLDRVIDKIFETEHG